MEEQPGIVHAIGVEGGKHVFGGVNGGVVRRQRGAPSGLGDVARKRRNLRAFIEVDTNEYVAGVGFCRLDGQGCMFPGVQANSFEGQSRIQGVLTVGSNHARKPTSVHRIGRQGCGL